MQVLILFGYFLIWAVTGLIACKVSNYFQPYYQKHSVGFSIIMSILGGPMLIPALLCFHLIIFIDESNGDKWWNGKL